MSWGLIANHGSDRNADPCLETGVPAAAAAGEAAAIGIVVMPKEASRSPSPGDDGAGFGGLRRSMWLLGVGAVALFGN